MNRKPVALDLDFDDANKKIVYGFESDFGPGEYPTKVRNALVKGVISPVYDYEKSSPVMAWAYKEIAEAEIPEVYVILGSCNRGINTYLFGNWDTPLGSVCVDVETGKQLIRLFPDIKNDAEPFMDDINIEMQLPFLQYAKKDNLSNLRILPILIGDVGYNKLIEFADALSNIDKKISIICSCNLTCYGKEFGNIPFVHGIKDNLHIIDEELINCIVNLDSKNFYDKAKKIKDRNVFVLCMEAVRGLGCKTGGLLHYYTSGELDDNYEKSVGMAAIIFR